MAKHPNTSAPLLALIWLGCLLFISSGNAAGLHFTRDPVLVAEKGKYKVSFAVSHITDIEVAIVNGEGAVVRHLAAGVLGREAPPPLLPNTLQQDSSWDGTDDYGVPVRGAANHWARVRAGMQVELEQIVGGDPYAFYSREMGQGDHAAWAISGLEAKEDGSVYVIGNGNNYGPAVLRAYDALGNYQRTVYPPPAGKPPERMMGWGIRTMPDGTYNFLYPDLDTPSPTTTLIAGQRAFVAGLLPSRDDDSLLLLGSGFSTLRINTDGTLPATQAPQSLLVDAPDLQTGHDFVGPTYAASSTDGRYLFLSGVFSEVGGRKRTTTADTDGFWRDGKVFRIERTTGKVATFFSLEEGSAISDSGARSASPIKDSRLTRYAAFHGVAVDGQNRVFVCDRQNRRILVLSEDGEIIREIPLAYADAIAVHPYSKALYVTTRFGDFYKRGQLKLLKFDDWSVDDNPSVEIPLVEKLGMHRQPSFLAVSAKDGRVMVWVAYTELPVRVYEDTKNGMQLARDFYTLASQRALDLQHMTVDPRTEEVYIHDGFGNCFRVADWSKPQFEKCEVKGVEQKGNPGRFNINGALGLAIDPRTEYFYLRAPKDAVRRYVRKGSDFHIASLSEGKESALTPALANDWRIHMGFGDRGLAVAPDGGIAFLGSTDKNDYSGPLYFVPPGTGPKIEDATFFNDFGPRPYSAGVKFDLHGNLYAGKLDHPDNSLKQSGSPDQLRVHTTGRIYKYRPTGSLAGGNLFPQPPQAPEKVYDIEYGSIGFRFARTPRFDVDGYGRIYYPNSLSSRVSVIDNEGNAIFSFGTWGNRDSMGGLPGDTVTTVGVPMAFPSSVSVTEDYIYVSDLVNMRLLRLKKTFRLIARTP